VAVEDLSGWIQTAGGNLITLSISKQCFSFSGNMATQRNSSTSHDLF